MAFGEGIARQFTQFISTMSERSNVDYSSQMSLSCSQIVGVHRTFMQCNIESVPDVHSAEFGTETV